MVSEKFGGDLIGYSCTAPFYLDGASFLMAVANLSAVVVIPSRISVQIYKMLTRQVIIRNFIKSFLTILCDELSDMLREEMKKTLSAYPYFCSVHQKCSTNFIALYKSWKT